uniref:Uncharacterized protein n=1 Tax=mine drainage metagenome TaxID=410659 RepID=E6QLX8_9ZZZZ
METTKLGRPTWPAYDTNAVLYRISHSYLLVIDDLEWKDGDTSTPCVEAYLIMDGGLGDEITGMVLKKAVRLTESMAGQSMLDLFLCQEKERDEFYGHVSPFWEVNRVRCETLTLYDPTHACEVERFLDHGHVDSCYNEYEHIFDGNILNDLGRSVMELGLADAFLRHHHHLPRVTNRYSKETAAKEIEAAFIGALSIRRWEDADQTPDWVNSWEMDAILHNPWANHDFTLSLVQVERAVTFGGECVRMHDNGRVMAWLVDHHNNPGVVRAGKEMYAIQIVKEHLQRNGLDHMALGMRTDHLTWTRAGYLGGEPTPDHVQIYIGMIRELDSMVTRLTHRINREGSVAWGEKV